MINIFNKLACCNLWREVLEVFEITHPYRLPSATYRSCLNKIHHQMVDTPMSILDAIDTRVKKMVQQTSAIPRTWAEEAAINGLYNKLLDDLAIEHGEALLATITLSVQHASTCHLATGDKRFIDAMQKRFPAEFNLLKPRLLSLEGCVIQVIRACGIEKVKRLMADGLVCDTTLRVAFQGHPNKSSEDIIGILSIYDKLS